MKTSTSRILTTHTGSLHRPPDLEELFRRKLAGEPYEEGALEARLRSGVAEIVRKQAEIGIDIVDDGEYSKVDFFSYAKYRLDGLERRTIQPGPGVSANKFLHPSMKSVMSSLALRQRFAEFYADTEPATGVTTPPSVVQMYLPVGSAVEPPAVYAVVGPLKYKRQEITRDIANLKAALPGVKVEEVFMPAVAPAMWADRHANEHYASEEQYYAAVAEVLNQEYRAIVDAGFLLQIDDVSMPGRYRVQVAREGMAAFKKWMGLAVEAQNAALNGIPPEKVRYHMCWASQNAPHTDDAPLTELIDAILAINAQGYQLEAANVRHEHEWKVWKDVKLASDKILMPGVICHATNVIEHPDYVAERIMRYTGIVGRERVIAATDCGFRWRVHPQIAWAKMEALVAGAAIASKELWRK